MIRLIKSTMAYELLTVLLGGCVAAVIVVVLAFRSKSGQAKNPTPAVTSTTALAPTTEHVAEEHKEGPIVASPPPFPEPEPAPEPAPALYETVQPPPTPVTYTAPSPASFGAPTLAKKPTRTYRRRTAPVRTGPEAKKNLAAKHKKS